MTDNRELLRKIPSVSGCLESAAMEALADEFGRGMVSLLLRRFLEALRADILEGKIGRVPDENEIAESLRPELARTTSPEGKRAVNATGILLHTALGRAPLAGNAVDSLGIFGGYSVLQVSLDDGKRCRRDVMIENMLRELTGCEAATVVNNNAEATMLILNTLAKGKDAVVSRGQLVEIGGSFRMPDVMAQSGAVMREIGTTNRTHLNDYSGAVGGNTGVIVHVHTSNYRIRGFSGMPDIKEICGLRGERFPDIPVMDDLGSGALVPLSEFGLTDEPLVGDSLKAGADVVCFSGDKLISGPQCGIICGRKDIIERIRKNPFARMFRTDKMMLSVLERTLIHFVNGTYKDEIPLYRMLAADIDALGERAETLRGTLQKLPGIITEITDGTACAGSGSIPDEEIPDKVLRVRFSGDNVNLNRISEKLRKNIPSVFARIADDALLFHMRTLLPGDLEILGATLPAVFSESVDV